MKIIDEIIQDLIARDNLTTATYTLHSQYFKEACKQYQEVIPPIVEKDEKHCDSGKERLELFKETSPFYYQKQEGIPQDSITGDTLYKDVVSAGVEFTEWAGDRG